MKFRLNRLAVVAALVIPAAGPLAGCAGVGDSFASSAFVEPARYDMYDCQRLATERVSLVTQADAKQALIDKARTGTGGAVIGEVVYRNDYISLRAQKKLADQAWQNNNCDAVTPPPLPPAAALPAPVAPTAAAPKPR